MTVSFVVTLETFLTCFRSGMFPYLFELYLQKLVGVSLLFLLI